MDTNEAKTLIVYRGPVNPGDERFVNVRDGAQLWRYIDPQAMVKSITRRERCRHRCIASFLAGLRATGATVIVEDRRYFVEPRRYEFTFATCELDRVYFMIGVLFARGEYGMLRRAIKQEGDMDKREQLLEQVAELYWESPDYPVYNHRLKYKVALRSRDASKARSSA
jgi:hypothetical protein